MVSSRTRRWSPIALLLGLLLVGTLAVPAEAAITRTLSLRSSVSVTGTGSPVVFAGTLTKSPVGSNVRLQIKAGSTWLDARALKTTTAAGAYKVSVNMPTYVGTYYFRSIASAGGGLSSAISNTVSITVLRKVSAVIKPTKTLISAGEIVTFNGHVSPCVVGSSVTLKRYSAGSWVTVTTANLSSKCTFARAVRPAATTSYRLSVPRRGSYAPAYSAVVKITVDGPAPTPPTITTTSLPDGSVGTAYSQALTKTGGAGTWSKTSGTLPTGLGLPGSTGVLSGTPTVGGTFNFTVRFTETATGLAASKALSVTIVSGPAITTDALPDGKRGDPYSFTLTKTGGTGAWSALHVPNGMSLDPSTGLLSGTPIVEGDFVLAAKFTEDGSGQVANKSLPLHIETSPPPVITTTTATLAEGVKNVAYSATLAKTGNAGTWSITQGALPTGVTLNTGTGALTGTPSVSGDYLLTVKFLETAAQTADTETLVLHVSPAASSPTIDTDTLVDGKVGTAYSVQLDGEGAGTWSLTPTFGGLPPGLSLNTLTGVISGTPTVAGYFDFQVAYQSLGNNTKLLSIRIVP